MRRRRRTHRALPSPLVFLLGLPFLGACDPGDPGDRGAPGSSGEPGSPAQRQGELAATIVTANEALLVRGETGSVGDFFAPDYVVHSGGETMTGGPTVIEAFVTDLRTAFPDLEIEVEILMEGPDRVAWRRTHRGTHRGPYMGVSATDRPLEWEALAVTRFEDGRIAEEWAVTDLDGKLRAAASGAGEAGGDDGAGARGVHSQAPSSQERSP